ncbi:MazG family protein [Microlunatus elymi]|uniref:MazG family protein n=1 Tax=Microlunatus elymi TaxID=2596828 RepID=A0A516Q6G7_9ACTN|nr:MazG family protein [Microlunatus elymi]QDP98982.1 MazG family protein [Microlunatus elymi]
MQTLRTQCPWDAEQNHRSLIQYLIEETCEVVEAIEGPGGSSAGEAVADHDHLREELGDLLLQVIFHSTIAGETDPDFTVGSVARGVADKLIARHPYVYADGEVPQDLHASWEERKAAEKGRKSVLEGIPEQLSALARANKIISRARSRSVPVELADSPIDADTVGEELIKLVARAQAGGVDADQAARDAVRRLESRVVEAESSLGP